MPPEAEGKQDTPPRAPEDLRVRRTRRALRDALVELALDRPFGTITVRDLTDRAGIGYATFFRHYRSPEDLLRSMLAELMDELVALLRPISRDDPQGAGRLLFRHAARHADRYRVLLRTSRAVDLLPTIVRVGVDNVHLTYAPKPDGRVPAEVAAHHFIRSLVDLIEWWLDRDMPYDAERMSEIYMDLIVRPTLDVALEPRSDDDTATGA